MSKSTNIIYNGDFHNGTDSWSGNMSVNNGELTVKGYLSQDVFTPVSSNQTYRLTYDIKFLEKDKYNFYIAFYPYDNSRTMIAVSNTYKPIGESTNTTLAADLNNGDTTVTLTSSASWPTNRTYQRVGICNIPAYGYGRCSASYSYSSISGNVVTLKSAYNGNTIKAGTKVAEFEDGGTYFYPHYIPSNQLPSEWTTYSVDFVGGNNIRYSCQYFRFATLGYNHKYIIRNIRMECISSLQHCHISDNENKEITKQGEFKMLNFNEHGMPVRYIRDTIQGSSANSYNHWNEVKVFNSIGENLAWNHPFKIGDTTYTNSTVHDGIIDSNWVGNNQPSSFFMDLGYVETISKIQIWHYYADGRTYYNNVTEVSLDGTNWITVYSGQKPETVNGNTIDLTSHRPVMYDTGDFYCNQIIEL